VKIKRTKLAISARISRDLSDFILEQAAQRKISKSRMVQDFLSSHIESLKTQKSPSGN
jgi:hypothetical protein